MKLLDLDYEIKIYPQKEKIYEVKFSIKSMLKYEIESKKINLKND